MSAISNDELKRRLILDNSEKVLSRLMREVDWPFLGLFGEALNQAMRRAVFEAINANPTVSGYVRHLDLYPALFSVYLCQILMQTFGQADHFQLWPEIQRALRLREPPSTAERQQLWMAFRQACIELGLEVSPRLDGPHYMVEEFLRQVGLSVAFSGDLAARMFRFAHRSGLPDEDDPQGIEAWQETLCLTLNIPFSITARKAVELDAKGYYTQVFLRVASADGQVGESPSLLEQAFGKALQDSGASAKRLGRVAIPQVVLQNDVLGVLLPGGMPREWMVEVDRDRRKFRTSGTEEFVPFDNYLPIAVAIHDESDHRVVSLPLWEDERNNRILIFSAETGLLRGRGMLGGGAVTVSPGVYLLLSRFDPEIEGVESEHLSEDPVVYLTPLNLGPGKRIELRRGPAALAVSANAEPMVQWEGEGIVSREGHTVYPGGKMSLRIEVPEDLRRGTTGFEVEISAGGAGQSRVVSPLEFGEDGAALVHIGEAASAAGWQAGVWRLLAQLRRIGEARTLARSAALCWIGLKEFRSGLRFVCAVRPANLFEAGCDNVQATSQEVACREASRRSMRLVFALDARREIALSWAVPGVFVDLLEYDEQGLAVRKPLAVGGTLLASTASSQQLVISSHENATLRLGAFDRRVNFTHRGSVTLPLGSLADRLSAESTNLTYQGDSQQHSITLVHLIRPHEILSFESRLETGRAMLRFATGSRIQAVQVRVLELISGLEQVLVADSSDPSGNHSRAGLAQMLITKREDGALSTTVFLDISDLSPGAWLLRFEVLQDGTWGRLTNTRGDYYAAGMLIGEDGRFGNGNSLSAVLMALEPGEVPRALRRFHEAMQYCYAEPSWMSVRWLDPGWRTLVDLCADQGEKMIGTLFDLVASPLPESSSPSWIPQLTVLARKPQLLALPASTYAALNERNSVLMVVLAAMAKLPTTLAHSFQGLLHMGVVGAFSNARKICQHGEHPRGFDPDRYKDALRQTDDRGAIYLLADDHFIPGEGQLCGSLHYRFAKRSLEERFARSLGGNDVRRGQALWMGREAMRRLSRLSLSDRRFDPVIDPWPAEMDESTPDFMAQKVSMLRSLEHFISVLSWHCRLESRQPGALQQFLRTVAPDDVDATSPLGFILHVGDALLGFYLLLWEIVMRADLNEESRPQGVTANA